MSPCCRLSPMLTGLVIAGRIAGMTNFMETLDYVVVVLPSSLGDGRSCELAILLFAVLLFARSGAHRHGKNGGHCGEP